MTECVITAFHSLSSDKPVEIEKCSHYRQSLRNSPKKTIYPELNDMKVLKRQKCLYEKKVDMIFAQNFLRMSKEHFVHLFYSLTIMYNNFI